MMWRVEKHIDNILFVTEYGCYDVVRGDDRIVVRYGRKLAQALADGLNGGR